MIYLTDLVNSDMGVKDVPWEQNPPKPPPKPQAMTGVPVTHNHAPIVHNNTDFYLGMALIPITFIFIVVIAGVMLCRD